MRTHRNAICSRTNLALCLLVAFGTPSAGFAASYTETGIETPTAGSADGTVQVGYRYAGRFCHPYMQICWDNYQGRRWADGATTNLQATGNGFVVSALGLSPDGAVTYGTAEGSSSYLSGARWENGQVDLLTEASLAELGYLAARDGSADGQTIVGQSGWFVGGTARAVRWVGDLEPEDLGDLGGPGLTTPQESAFAVSTDGSVIVGRSSSPSGPEAFRWESGSMAGLGDLPGGDFESAAYAISDDGSVIVGYVSDASGRRAARWVGGVLLALPSITIEALGVSPNGQYIVGRSDSGAFIWHETDGLSLVRERLVDSGVIGLPASISSAFSVSNDGLVVGGDTGEGGYVATLDPFVPKAVPLLAPFGLALLGLGLVAGGVAAGFTRSG